MKRLFLICCFFFAIGTSAHAVSVQRVVSPGGIEAWLVEDHKLPILSLSFAFRGGMALDPAGKPGVANFVSTVLDEGAGTRTSEEFQAALEDNDISLQFNAGRDSFDGSVKTLTRHQDLALELLHDALTAPHLNTADIERMRDGVLATIKRYLADPEWVAQRSFNNAVFRGHPYGQPGIGTIDSVTAITTDDLKTYIHDHFGRDQLLVTVTGDINPEALAKSLDRVFGDLPAKAAEFHIAEISSQAEGQTLLVDKPIPESVLVIGGPGLKRDDPDWYAGEIMNYVLGGGGFNSRLMTEVREKQALTYGVFSGLVPYQHAGLIHISGSTKNEDAGKAIGLIFKEIKTMAGTGATDSEIKDAKTYLTGALPLELTSTNKIAEVLLSMRLNDLPIDYLSHFDAYLNGVKSDDVKRVAKRLLDPAKFTTIVLGQPQGVTATSQ